MKKKLSIWILLALIACVGCVSLGACGSKEKSPTPDSTSEGPTWEDENIVDQEHSGIELPEIERP